MSDTEESSVRKGQGPKVAIAQIDPALGDLNANMDKHREAIARAKQEGVDLLVFPELSLTGYRLKDSVPEVALTRQCPELLELGDLSKDLSIVAGLVLESTEHFFFNASVYFEDGKVHFLHRKVYLPTYGMFDEQRYFARGNHIAAFPTKHGKMAILCCEDMLHPSALLIAALDGAGVVIVPSASPARGVAEEGAVDANGRAWEEYNHAMARTYGIFIVHANRAGVEDGHTFWGGSELVGPSGETLAKAAYYAPDFVSAVLPESLQRRQRLQAPMLRDEDVDLTINELCRVRGRERPVARPQQRSEAPEGRRQGGPPFQQGGQRDRGRGGRAAAHRAAVRRAVGVTSATVAAIAMTGETVTTAGIGMTVEIVTTEGTATTAEIATTVATATIAAIAVSVGRDRRRFSRADRTIGTATISVIDPSPANGWIHASVRRAPPLMSRASPWPTTPTIPSTEDGARCT